MTETCAVTEETNRYLRDQERREGLEPSYAKVQAKARELARQAMCNIDDDVVFNALFNCKEEWRQLFELKTMNEEKDTPKRFALVAKKAVYVDRLMEKIESEICQYFEDEARESLRDDI